nr:hypothetical protein [Desulfobacterales bacterium]
MRYIHVFLFILGSLFPLASCDNSPSVNIVLRVEDLVLTLPEFNEYFESVKAAYSVDELKRPSIRRIIRLRLLHQLLDEMVILKRAEELDLNVTDQELEKVIKDIKSDYPRKSFEDMLIKQVVSYSRWKKMLKRRLLIEKVIKKELLQKINVAEEKVKTTLEKQDTSREEVEYMRISHILLPTLKEAKEILRRAKSGEDFGLLARKYSIGSEAPQGGDMGYIVKGELPNVFEDAISDLAEGSISSIIKTPSGFHIFKVIEKNRDMNGNAMESFTKNKTYLERERLDKVYGPWIKGLKARYHIEINPGVI